MFSLERTCKNFCHLLGAYADGELEPSAVCAIEEHVTSCEGCRERVELDRAIRGSLKRTVRTPCPDGLRGRAQAAMAAALSAEAAKKELKAREAERTVTSAPWRTIVPLASAAALAMVWGAATRGPMPTAARRPVADSDSTRAMRAGFGDEMLEEFVAEHSRPLPPERTDPKDVRAFEQYVGVPVRARAFERAGARLIGGRLVPLHQERAAMLQYEIGNGPELRRVSVLIYDPRRIQVNGEELAPRAVGTSEVRVGRANGYSVAVTQHAGVGYALASDLDTERSAQLAALAEE